MKTLVISGSIRSSNVRSEQVSACVANSSSLQEYIDSLGEYQETNGAISNSDILAGAVLMGMKTQDVGINYFPLIKLFPRREKGLEVASESIDTELSVMDTLSLRDDQLELLNNAIASSQGIVLSTPVYFGDRSSVANKLLQLAGIHKMLENKVFGTVSVGAKRNGGQETTVIYSLFEALNQNAMVVGNGPPTSQYGGTAVGGHKGTVIKDAWGLETAFGTGTRVAHVSKLLNKGKSNRLGRPIKILVLVTMDDTKQILVSFLEKFLTRAEGFMPNVEFQLENVLNSTIFRCLACDTCPSDGTLSVGERPTRENHRHCMIRDPEDSMHNIHDMMLDADGIIIAGLNVKQHSHLLYRYQVLTERTRYIRRDHFELTDKLITAFSFSQVGARINSLHSMKIMTSYIRHNAVIHMPIEVFVYEDKVLNDCMEDLVHFVRHAEALAIGRDLIEPLAPEYSTKGIGGY